MAKNKNEKSRRTVSKAQSAARVREAREREERAVQAREKSTQGRRIFTIVVCVILILALFIPSMALTMCSAA